MVYEKRPLLILDEDASLEGGVKVVANSIHGT